jgi:hypothetical protein
MPIVLGNDTITGLGVGGLPNGTVNADDLASGAVTRAKMGYGGAVLQTLQWTYGSHYENFAQNSEYDMPGVLGDGTPNITLTSSSNQILIKTVMHCGQEDTWRGNFFRIYYSIAGGSWTLLTGGGFSSIVYTGGHNGMMGSVGTTLLTTSWNTASNIRFKVTQIGHANGGYLHLNQNNTTNSQDNNNTISAASSIMLQEIRS